VSDPYADSERPAPENDEDDPALSLSTKSLLRPRRALVAIVTLVIVFGITASLVVIGINKLEQIEPTQAVQKDASTSLVQPDSSPLTPVEPFPKPLDSLMLEATRSYLSSNNANAQAPTDIERMRACLTIEDGYKERLDCYDSTFPPEPKPKPPVAKLPADCRFLKEQDARLACFNRFLAPPKPQKIGPKATPKTNSPK
jgi:hypothetical protein